MCSARRSTRSAVDHEQGQASHRGSQAYCKCNTRGGAQCAVAISFRAELRVLGIFARSAYAAAAALLQVGTDAEREEARYSAGCDSDAASGQQDRGESVVLPLRRLCPLENDDLGSLFRHWQRQRRRGRILFQEQLQLRALPFAQRDCFLRWQEAVGADRDDVAPRVGGQRYPQSRLAKQLRVNLNLRCLRTTDRHGQPGEARLDNRQLCLRGINCSPPLPGSVWRDALAQYLRESFMGFD